ncbi:MAG: UDP-N-acetylglucosamine-1-phosphate transferase [Thaumarchaeota archaeon]|nr:UDP-N-acetylglucosamine-1-phosphate transferase [Nitrososphaerota archaeon]
MLPGQQDAFPLFLIFLSSLAFVFLLLPPFMKYLVRRNRVVDDVHKQGGVKVPSPAGPLLVLALVIGEGFSYAFYPSVLPLVIVAVVLIASAVGLADDIFVLGGRIKPLLLLLSAIPLVAAGAAIQGVFDPRLYFPLFTLSGAHFTIYSILVLAALPIVSNAFNMVDSFNGEVSGFTILVSLALILGMILRASDQSDYSVGRLSLALPLAGASLGFYFYNRYPSRVFDGDSGSLALGAMYAALAVIGGVELAAVVAIIPAILNSFYILSSVRGLVERRMMGARPTKMGEDGLLYARREPTAPTTLVRMILLDGPLSEKGVVHIILILTAYACFLSAVTSALTWLL